MINNISITLVPTGPDVGAADICMHIEKRQILPQGCYTFTAQFGVEISSLTCSPVSFFPIANKLTAQCDTF